MESYIVLNFLFKMFFRKVKVKVLVVVEVVSSLWFKILKVIEWILIKNFVEKYKLKFVIGRGFY